MEEFLFAQKLGQNLSELEVRTFVRIQSVIWDHLLALKASFIFVSVPNCAG